MKIEKPRLSSLPKSSIEPGSATLAECRWEALPEASCAQFAAWLDDQLERLEQRFRSYTTPRSLMKAIR